MIVLVALISGCAGGLRTSDSWCILNTPIYVNEEIIKAAPNETKRSIIEHNEFGERKCGWGSTG